MSKFKSHFARSLVKYNLPLLLALSLFIQAPCPQVQAQSQVSPERIYGSVWRIIKEDYYDQSFNGQDWERWKTRYKDKLKTLDDAHKAIETMLASLGDKYTRFLDRDAFAEERSQIKAELFGVGIQIGSDKSHRIVVIQPIEDTPAFRAGVQSGDLISEVNGESTNGLSVDEAAKKIKGERGTPVELTLIRSGERLKLKMVRDGIRIKSVQTAKMLDSDIGYIRLSTFISNKASDEMKHALQDLAKARAIILDLRDNPGGLLSNAIDVSNMFLEGKAYIVSTVDPDGYKTPTLSTGQQLTQQPLVVLINKGSASASEIASGALKDNDRAILVGQTTFGKGLVQGIQGLADQSGLNYTIARYLTPSDDDINNKGISPDVLVELSTKDLEEGKGPWWWIDQMGPAKKRQPEDMQDIQLKKAMEVLKSKLNPTTIGMGKNSGETLSKTAKN